MGIRIDITADVKRAQRFANELSQAQINSAMSLALNQVARTVNKLSREEVWKRRRLKKRRINQGIKIIERAKPRSLRAVVWATKIRIPLKDYQRGKQTLKGVKVNVTGKTKTIRSAFGPGYEGTRKHTIRRRGKKVRVNRAAPRILGGHIFTRTSPRRKPIQKHWGPTIGSGFLNRTVQRKQREVIRRDWRRVQNDKLNDKLRKLRAKYGRA